MQRRGHINTVFSIDTDHIELAPASSHSDVNSTGSQNNLTDSQTNFKFIITESGNNSRSATPQNLVRRWSRNLQKFGKSKTQKTTERHALNLPSRNLFAIEGQLLVDTSDLEIDQLANEIEQNEELMEDSADGENLRMDTIRALPHSLTTKRKIKEKLAISVSRNSSGKPKGFYKFLIYKSKRTLSYLTSYIRNTFRNIEFWYDSMKQIEGHFGSGVSAYFQFLRWLFTLNLFLFIFTLGFIILPQILFDIFQLNNEISYENNNNNNKSLKFLDFFTGEGYLKKSILFYGAYTNMTINLGTYNDYSLPHAYFLTMLCLYSVTFFIVSMSMARSYRRSFIETSGGVRNLIAHKVFCSWDFGISNKKAAKLKHLNIFNELKEMLNEMNGSKEKSSKIWKFWIFCSQLTAHLLVFAVLGGLGIGMWILLQYFGEENESSPWTTLYLAITVNITFIVLQMFFSWVARMEDYTSPRRALHITLLRNFLLEGIVIVVLILFWLNKNYHGCWETSIGQEIYRLIIVDFFISILGSSVVQLIQVFIIKKIFPDIKRPSFDISRKSLGLVFNQTLLWVGLLFSPLLAAVVVLKMILTFYIKKLTLLRLCKSPTHLWRSAQTQTLYLVMTFLSLIGVLIVHGYIMTQVPISQTCGPFRGTGYMFQIFIDGVLDLQEHHLIWRIVTTFARPAVMGGILLTMTVIVYYLRSKSRARIAMVKLLKDMLYLEAKDKEFLLWNIARVSEGREWLFNENNVCDEDKNYRQQQQQQEQEQQQQYNENHSELNKDIFAGSSSTWNYQEEGNSSMDDSVLRSRHI